MPEPPDSAGERLAAIVGLGASAGGVAAIKEFFAAMPPTTGIAFVVVMHLDPQGPNMLVDLLAGLTGLAVAEAADNQAVEPDHVYIIPPGKNLLLDQGRMRLEPRTLTLPTAIDTFFRSLAEERQERAVGVVLSGGGSDGALGIREIKARGGLVLVQDPATAEHGEMPQSAIATEMVDFVLPPGEMPEFLLRYTKQPYLAPNSAVLATTTWTADFLQEVLTLVDQRIGHDFRSYKESTLRRRIWRRMSLRQTQQPMEYVQVLRDNPAELDALARDLVISVTYFFRDPDAWQVVEEQVLPELIATRRPDVPLRVWVPGCSTGEEAYSLGILLLEQLEAQGTHRKIQVFATDINEHALEKARAGVYPETIAADVSSERLRRFFIKEGANYRISKKVRECVVFATHNVVSDPAFSRLDLISCRNLLIYLDHEAQKRVMPVFHYALREGGFLILGGAESVVTWSGSSRPFRPSGAIFRRIGASRSERVPPPFPLEPPGRSRIRPPAGLHPPARSLTEIAQQLTLDHFGPASALVDRQYRVLVLCGPTDRFLRVPSGEIDAELLSMVREGLRAKVRSALHQAAKDGGEVTQSGRVKRNGDYYQVQIVVTPVNVPDFQEGVFLVTFHGGTEVQEPAPEPSSPTSTEEQYVRQLERELQETRAGAQQHHRAARGLQRGAQGFARGSRVDERGAAVEQRGAGDLEGRAAVAQRGIDDAQQPARREGGAVGGHHQRPRQPVDQHRHRHAVPRHHLPHPAVYARGRGVVPPDSHRRRPADPPLRRAVQRGRPVGRRQGRAGEARAQRSARADAGRPLVHAANASLPHPRQPHRGRGGHLPRRHATEDAPSRPCGGPSSGWNCWPRSAANCWPATGRRRSSIRSAGE